MFLGGNCGIISIKQSSVRAVYSIIVYINRSKFKFNQK